MAIERKNTQAAKPVTKPQVEKDPGILQKKESVRAQKEKAKAEKEKVLGKKPGKLEKLIMTAVPETESVFMSEDTIETGEKIQPKKNTVKKSNSSKTAKNNTSVSQNGENIQSENMVQEKEEAPKKRGLDKDKENSIAEALKDVEEYAAEMVQKSRYKEADPKKVALGIFLVLPECESITNQQFANHFKIGRNTVTRWGLDKTVIKVRNEFSEIYFKRFTPKILSHLIKWAQKTSWVNGLVDTAAIKLFLQYVEKWNEKQEVDLTSDGKAITWGVAPSQFVRKDQIKDKDDEEDDDEDLDD